MPPSPPDHSLPFVLLTVLSWGVYGVLLHTGQIGMQDPLNGRYKAFLFVGFAYVLVAVIAPLLMLALSGANWKFTADGMGWSLVAGIAGAIGAFGVLLAFGFGGRPAVVMALVFAGAPVVNAIVSLVQHPPEGGMAGIPFRFWLGILLAAAGGYLVSKYKPLPPKAMKPAEPAAAISKSLP